MNFGIYKLGQLGELSLGMLKLGELVEVSFRICKLCEQYNYYFSRFLLIQFLPPH